ncbi:hypothetical protein BDK51DRAFT_33066 [Blyttiomyces helicus]|uniref:Uncharacterized protein n=1 Tax=Blyttiomyces helicus TaxID=388810 RepID=A0A4P9WUD2_9FUNG|nr:hypothetical protein BDK51DRAFT_33066 [Blyttiomyces helicus]|eukprot:RKO94696.1 hypothetical protein BDK51DRAFT_33066 [Blyttiomyces helicus]
MYIWQDDGLLNMLSFNVNNFSNFKYNAAQCHNIKADETPAVNRRQAFSTFTLNKVIANFSIEEDSEPRSVDSPPTPSPLHPGLSYSISIIAARNFMHSESARRTIISLYLSYALLTLEPPAKHLTIAEEININIIKNVKNDGISENVEYKQSAHIPPPHYLMSKRGAKPHLKRGSARSSRKLLAFFAVAESRSESGVHTAPSGPIVMTT